MGKYEWVVLNQINVIAFADNEGLEDVSKALVACLEKVAPLLKAAEHRLPKVILEKPAGEVIELRRPPDTEACDCSPSQAEACAS